MADRHQMQYAYCHGARRRPPSVVRGLPQFRYARRYRGVRYPNGKEIEALPIGGVTEDLAFDPRSGRIYASCGTGYIYVYQERDPDHYDLVGKVESDVMGKTSLLVPELNRFLVAVPHIGGTM
jgi:hypothetical protein